MIITILLCGMRAERNKEWQKERENTYMTIPMSFLYHSLVKRSLFIFHCKCIISYRNIISIIEFGIFWHVTTIFGTMCLLFIFCRLCRCSATSCIERDLTCFILMIQFNIWIRWTSIWICCCILRCCICNIWCIGIMIV